jgi:CRISPR-associated protein Csh2
MKMNELKNNREYLFFFEASLCNPNGDPDQENKPRMDYETNTVLVSNGRRNRDIRDFLKEKGYKIFVDVLEENKVGMDKMFDFIVENYLKNSEKMNVLKGKFEEKNIDWLFKTEDYQKEYNEIKKDIKKNKKDKDLTKFNNELMTEIIKEELIDIRLFGSAMAVKNLTRTYTGPIQTSWGYSLHPVELVKSNSITSMMNDDNSTFGKTHQIHYGLIAHYGTINKFSARKTGMSEEDLTIFRKALVQSMMNNMDPNTLNSIFS